MLDANAATRFEGMEQKMKTNRLTRNIARFAFMAIALTGCATAGASSGEGQMSAPTVDRSTWPTPDVSQIQATATPFVLVTLPATPVSVAGENEIAAPVTLEADGIDADVLESVNHGRGEEIQPQPSAVVEVAPLAADSSDQSPALSPQNSGLCAESGLFPGVSGEVAPAGGLREVDMFRGPGGEYEPIVTVYAEDPVDVLAVNQGGDWALVKPQKEFESPGWISVQNLQVEGFLDDVPHVHTGWVESNAVSLMSEPGIFAGQIGTLAINDMVVVVGVDDSGRWACVAPVMGGGSGWLPKHFVALGGTWNQLAVVSNPVPSGVASEDAGASVSTALTGKLVIQLSSGGEVVAVNADGSGLHHLTYGIDPALSPDGNMVAVTRWEYGGESSALWLVDTATGTEKAVLGEMRKAKGPEWSPDGTQIALNRQGGGHLDEKEECSLLVDLNTGQQVSPNVPTNAYDIKVTTREGLPYLCWNVPPDAMWGLRVVDVNTGSVEDVDGGSYAFRPTWDPNDSQRVICDSGYGLLETYVDRQQTKNLTNAFGDGSPVFSPDGGHIAFVARQNNTYDIHRVNADGSGRIALTKTPLWVTGAGDPPWSNVAPAWSPDGNYISFLTDRTGRWEIWLMGGDGSDPHPMFSEEVNDQLPIGYDYNDERVFSWR